MARLRGRWRAGSAPPAFRWSPWLARPTAPVVQALLEAGALGESSVVRDWPLSEIAALLSLARAVVGNDSGPTHLAAAVGCPTVALFGPPIRPLWAPLGAHVRVIAGPPRRRSLGGRRSRRWRRSGSS